MDEYTRIEKTARCIDFLSEYATSLRVKEPIQVLHIKETVSSLTPDTIEKMCDVIEKNSDGQEMPQNELDILQTLTDRIIECSYKSQVMEGTWNKVKRGELELFADEQGRIVVNKPLDK